MPRTRRSLPKKLYSENANSASGRLSESCVSEIFDCIKKGKVPTGDIAFNIIKTTEKKLMLSPPSYEFGDGIYVLLRNMSDSHNVVIPSNLEHLVLNVDDVATSAEVCKWSLSGPASKSQKKGALQQRYSYPRGRPAYSNTKGGSLWTMIDSTGSDGLDVRVFHVYHSLKRLSSGSGSGGTSGSGSSDWSSSSKATKSRKPLKKRIKMEEDERVAQINSVKNRPKKMARMEDDGIDALMREQVGSPEIASFDLDTSLNISEDAMFGDDVDYGYSFMPVPNAPSILPDMEPIPVSARSLYYQPHSTYAYNGMNPTPLPYSYDMSSQNTASVSGRPLGLLAFSNKLYQLQDCIFNDISATQSTEEQAQKLAVLQHWSRATAQRPLQPNAFAPAPVKQVPSSRANVPTPGPIPELSSKEGSVEVKDTDNMDNADKPSITP
eukprot:scaffold30521_cov113-Skeletonema_marinoi.AAC.1